jgi:hypothetical protein
MTARGYWIGTAATWAPVEPCGTTLAWRSSCMSSLGSSTRPKTELHSHRGNLQGCFALSRARRWASRAHAFRNARRRSEPALRKSSHGFADYPLITLRWHSTGCPIKYLHSAIELKAQPRGLLCSAWFAARQTSVTQVFSKSQWHTAD